MVVIELGFYWMEHILKNLRICIFSSAILFGTLSCSFLQDKEFFDSIEKEVSVANADKIDVYIRYAATKFGTTTPVNANSCTIKNGVPFSVTATTNAEYGFYKWAAFSESDFPHSKQQLSLVYVSPEDYEENFLSKELSSDIVTFSSPHAESTEVTVKQTRSDIWIVPVIAERPTVSYTMPEQSETIVRNAKLSIQFDKAMDINSIYDAESGLVNYKIEEGSLDYDVNGDRYFNATDITQYFKNPDISLSKKVIIFSFDPDADTNSFSAKVTARIILNSDIKDAYGYSLASGTTLSWKVGSNFDTLAPLIATLSAGIGSNYDSFASVDTALAQAATTSLDDSLYTDTMLLQRAGNVVNIYVLAKDIATGSIGEIADESGVATVGIRATSLIDRNGLALDTSASENIITPLIKAYAPGYNASDGVSFNAAEGSLYSFDISSLPDGIVKIDVWASDATGNDGLSETTYAENGNGYKSIFVVKDTTSPDIATEAAKVKSSSTTAPYGWYNAASVDSIVMYDEASNEITDVGHEKLRAPHDVLQWIFHIGADTTWSASAGDAAWAYIKDQYSISNADVTSDGAVDVTMRLMDDLGNISQAEPLESVLYDNTAPETGVLSWVTESGSTALNASETALLTEAYLRIPFTESLSGVKRIGITVASDAETVPQPLTSASFAYIADTLASPPSAAALTLDASDADATDTMVVLSETVTSGVLYVKNLSIGNSDGSYRIQVTLYDAALNEAGTQSITIARDTTAPVVEKVLVEDAVARTVYGESETTYWLSNTVCEADSVSHVTLTVTATESGSGVHVITLGQDASLTAASELVINGNALNAVLDYTLNTAENTIVLLDSYLPRVHAASGTVTFSITNVALSKPNAADGNAISVLLTDFVSNSGTNAQSAGASLYTLYVDENESTTVTKVYADTVAPAITLAAVRDGDAASASDENTYAALRVASAYTDKDTITLSVTLSAESAQSGSGIQKLTLSNAAFTTDTAVRVDGTPLSASAYTLAESTVTFAKTFVDANVLEFTNVKLLSADGAQSVGVLATDCVQWASETADSNEITLDTVSPTCGSLSWQLRAGVRGVTKTALVESQNLVVPFTETTSGIKQLALSVRANGATATVTPFADSSFELLYVASGAAAQTTLTSGTDYTIDGAKLVFAHPFTSGTFYLKNLLIADTFVDGQTYNITVHVTDAVLNGAEEDESLSIAADSTAPELHELHIVQLVPRVKAGASSADSYWVSKEAFASAQSAPSKVTAVLSIEETSTGIKTVSFGDNLTLTAASELTVTYADTSERTLTRGSDYTVDAANQLITFTSDVDALLKDEDGIFTLTITNAALTEDGANAVSVTLTDFALNSDVQSTSNAIAPVSGQAQTVSTVYVDYTVPECASLAIEDIGADADTVEAEDGFTNSTQVHITLSGAYDAGIGLYGISFVSGATVGDGTTVTINGSACSFTRSSETEIVFDAVYTSASASDTYTIVVRNASLTASSDGLCTVSAKVLDRCGWSSEAVTGSITLDTTPPEWDAVPVFCGSDNTSGTVYPLSTQGGIEISGATYFYTQESPMKLSVSYSESHYQGAVYVQSATISAPSNIVADSSVQALDSATNIPFATSGDARYALVIKDKAGNISTAQIFHVIQDTAITTNTGSLSLTTAMTKQESRSGYHVYLEKQLTDGAYRNRFSTSDGQTVSVAVDISAYTERTYTTSQSGLAYFALTASETDSPEESGTATDFNKWIPYTDAVGETLTLWIPALTTVQGPYYLWLKDHVGNTAAVQIRTPEHEEASVSETWLGSALVAEPTVFDYALGSASDATAEKDGALVTSGGVTYYNDSARYGLAGESDILFTGTASASDYPVRFALLERESTTALTKDTLASLASIDWTYPDEYGDASTAYAFTAREYLEDVSAKYLHYVLEDATGNITTAVLAPSGTASTWQYDAASPRVTLREDDSVVPSTVSAEYISSLIPALTKKQPFYDSDAAVIWLPSAESESSSLSGAGAHTYRSHRDSLYFDIAIAEDTAVTQYCYDTSATIALDDATWLSTASGNVDVTVPTELLSSTTAAPLYLHVRDIVGNVSTCMLSDGTYKLDSSAPLAASSFDPAYKLKENAYYAMPSTSGDFMLSIAFSGASYADDVTGVKVAIPFAWFSDTIDSVAGSGIYAYSFEPDEVPTIIAFDDEGKPCITFTKDVHYIEGSEKNFTIYVYDAVGNYYAVPVLTSVDTESPSFRLHFSLYSGVSDNTGAVYDAIVGTESPSDTLEIDTVFRGTDSAAVGYSKENPYIVYSSSSKAYVLGTFTASDTSGGAFGGISDIKIQRQKAAESAFTDITSALRAQGVLDNTSATPATEYLAQVPIDLDADGRLYEITVNDYAGNATVVYMALYADVTAPSFTELPTATPLVGSIHRKDDAYYYNTMQIAFKAKDVISATNSNLGAGAKTYALVDAGGTTVASGTLSEDEEVTITVGGDTATLSDGALPVQLTDKLGNTGSSSVYVASQAVSEWIRDVVPPVISAIADADFTNGRILNNHLYFAPGKADEGFELTITASDTLVAAGSTGAVLGYFASSSNAATSYEALSTTLSVTPSIYIAGADSGNAYVYAVDYAGNISEPYTLVVSKDENVPLILSVSAENTVPGADGTVYFNDASRISMTVKDMYSELTAYGFATSVDGTTYTQVSEEALSVAKETEQPVELSLSSLCEGNLYVYATNYQGIRTYYALPSETATAWAYDSTASALVSLASSTDGVYTAQSAIASGDTLYYRHSVTAIDFTATFESDESGIVGYKIGATEAAAREASVQTLSMSGNTAALSIEPDTYVAGGTSGSVYIFSVDALGNISSSAFVLALSKITYAPTVTGAEIAINPDTGVIVQSTSETATWYYNGEVTSIVLTPTFTVSDPTGIVGFRLDDSAATAAAASDATTYTVTSAASDGSTQVTLYAVNAIGCVSATGFTVTLVRDATSPSITALSLAATSPNSVNADAGIVYYNAENTTLSVTASDETSFIALYAVSTSETAPTAAASWTTTIPALPADASEASLYLHVRDFVGNTATKAFAANATYTDYSGAEHTAPASCTWSAAAAVPESAVPASVSIPSATVGHGAFLASENTTARTATLYYNSTLLASTLGAASTSLTVTPAVSAGEAVMGFMVGSEKVYESALEVSLSTSPVTIAAIDYAGNVSSDVFTLTIVEELPSDASLHLTLTEGKVYGADTLITAASANPQLTSGETYYTNAEGYTASVSTTLSANSSGIASIAEVSGNAADGYSITVTSAGSQTITATSNVGNEATFELVTSIDSTGPVVTALTLAQKSDTATSVYAHADDKKIYYNPTNTYISALTVTDTVSTQNLYAVSTSGTPDTEAGVSLLLGEHDCASSEISIAAMDVLGNISYTPLSQISIDSLLSADDASSSHAADSSYVSYYSLQSLAEAQAPTSVALTESGMAGNGVLLSAVDTEAKTATLYYSTAVLTANSYGTDTVSITPTAPASNGFRGFTADGGTTVGSTVTVSYSATSASIVSIDWAGNKSSAFTLTLTADTAPSLTCDSITNAFVAQTGASEYVSYYKAGESTVSLSITDSLSGVTHYAFTTADTAAPSAWTELASVASPVTVILPTMEDESLCYIVLKSAVGSETYFQLTNTENSKEATKWHVYEAVTAEDLSALEYYIDGKVLYLFTFPAGYMLKNVSVEGTYTKTSGASSTAVALSTLTPTVAVNASSASSSSLPFSPAAYAGESYVSITYTKDITTVTAVTLTDCEGTELTPTLTQAASAPTLSLGALTAAFIVNNSLFNSIVENAARNQKARAFTHEELEAKKAASRSRSAAQSVQKAAAATKARPAAQPLSSERKAPSAAVNMTVAERKLPAVSAPTVAAAPASSANPAPVSITPAVQAQSSVVQAKLVVHAEPVQSAPEPASQAVTADAATSASEAAPARKGLPVGAVVAAILVLLGGAAVVAKKRLRF